MYARISRSAFPASSLAIVTAGGIDDTNASTIELCVAKDAPDRAIKAGKLQPGRERVDAG
jgi:hypothetical protein